MRQFYLCSNVNTSLKFKVLSFMSSTLTFKVVD